MLNMKKNCISKIKLTKWPITNFKTLILLFKVYISGYWSWYGKKEITFIKKFAKIQNAKYVLTLTSATAGIENALIALGIKAGDEVIVPAYTWISTATAVARIGAIPVIVDIDSETLCISPSAIKEAITEKTRAIIPVHLFSALANMNEIMQIAKDNNLKVVEDCAHAHAAKYKDRGIGTIGDIGVFSFQQTKLMCCGEGGACTINNIKLADNIDRLNHIGYSVYSKETKTKEEFIYSKNILSEFQLAILEEQCNTILKQTKTREENAKYLEELLKVHPAIKCQQTPNETTRRSFYNFVFMIDSSRLKEGKSKYDIISNLNKFGLKAENGWGIPIYEHEVWNLPENAYIKKETTIAELKSKKEVITLPHTLLLAKKNDIKKAAQIIIDSVNQNIE